MPNFGDVSASCDGGGDGDGCDGGCGEGEWWLLWWWVQQHVFNAQFSMVVILCYYGAGGVGGDGFLGDCYENWDGGVLGINEKLII